MMTFLQTYFNSAPESTPAPADSSSSTSIETELSELVEKISSTPANELIGDLIDTLVRFGLKLLVALLIFIIGRWIIKKVRALLNRLFEKRQTDAAMASFIMSLISIMLTIMLIVTTIGTIGIDTTSIAALLTGGGVAIGLALNGTVQNFAGGLMILTFKPFRSGDFIEAQGHSGTVSEVNITTTKLTTTDNRVIIIPNGILSNDVINNYSSRKVRRLDLTIGVEYGSSSEETKKILHQLIKEDKRCMTIEGGAPEDPFIALSALNDSSVEFTIRIWVKSADYWATKFDMTEKIYNELPKHGIKFPFPRLDVNIVKN